MGKTDAFGEGRHSSFIANAHPTQDIFFFIFQSLEMVHSMGESGLTIMGLRLLVWTLGFAAAFTYAVQAESTILNGMDFDTKEIERLKSFEVLYVMDENPPGCNDKVPIDDVARRKLLPWVRELKDELTRSTSKPSGYDLRVRSDFVLVVGVSRRRHRSSTLLDSQCLWKLSFFIAHLLTKYFSYRDLYSF
jgi:hypothetical protein